MPGSGLGREKNALSSKMKIFKDAYFGRAKSILSGLALIAEKNVLLRKRSFAFSHSQRHQRT